MSGAKLSLVMKQYRQEAEQIAATVAAHQRGERLDRIELEALMRRSLEILKELLNSNA